MTYQTGPPQDLEGEILTVFVPAVTYRTGPPQDWEGGILTIFIGAGTGIFSQLFKFARNTTQRHII